MWGSQIKVLLWRLLVPNIYNLLDAGNVLEIVNSVSSSQLPAVDFVSKFENCRYKLHNSKKELSVHAC